MKKIITSVGTSLLINSKVNYHDIENENFHPDLFGYNRNNTDTNNHIRAEIQNIEKDLLEYVKKKGFKASAELSSIQKIDPEGESEIYLLCTETIPSYVCGRVLQKYLTEKISREIHLEYIPDLQVTNAKKFQDKGFLNLIETVKKICNAGKDHQIHFNISGGYKALIPAMTLLAQLERVSLYYLFEDNDELIEIGNLPMSFDWDVIEKYGILLHNEKKRNEPKYEGIVVEMRQLKLVKPESNELTFIGQLLASYSNQSSPLTATIFGYFIEHKLHESYSREYGPDKVEHSVKLPNGSGVNGDIDLLITPAEGQFISVEVKPSNYLENKEEVEKIQNNLIARTNAIKVERGTPVEVWLLVYSYAEAGNATITNRTVSEHELKLLSDLASALKTQIEKELTFRVKHFYIKKNSLRDERHIHQEFMKETLKIKTIKDLFVS